VHLYSNCKSENKLGGYDTLSPNDQMEVRAKSRERLLAYLLIKNSSNISTHDIVRNNLLEAFIAKIDKYRTKRSEAIELLNKYDEKKPPNSVASEETAFAQTGEKNQSTEKKGAAKKEVRDAHTEELLGK
jgi:hypothetical protein